MQQPELVVVYHRRIERAHRKLQCPPHLVDVCNTLQPYSVFFRIRHGEIHKTSPNRGLQDVGFRDFDIRWMRADSRGARWRSIARVVDRRGGGRHDGLKRGSIVYALEWGALWQQPLTFPTSFERLASVVRLCFPRRVAKLPNFIGRVQEGENESGIHHEVGSKSSRVIASVR